ncbi:MAG: hypothetical protein IJZ46_03590 [Bacilli bacterium]|nr:hypothetical protein [Bacilli bacterium]
MKYFTKDELDDITKELLENPTRETLKRLSEKYSSSSSGNNLVKEVPNMNIAPPSAVNRVEPALEVNKVENKIPSIEVPKVENVNKQEVPSFEIPKLETPAFNNQNNEPVNFNGDIFDIQKLQANNLMQTTDNFNTTPNVLPSTEIPVNNGPFFGTSGEVVNNPIPVSSPQKEVPTMFGQFEQNYM